MHHGKPASCDPGIVTPPPSPEEQPAETQPEQIRTEQETTYGKWHFMFFIFDIFEEKKSPSFPQREPIFVWLC